MTVTPYTDFHAPVVVCACGSISKQSGYCDKWRNENKRKILRDFGRSKADHLPGHAMMAFETKTKQRRRHHNNNRNVIISFWEMIWPIFPQRWPYFGWVAGSLFYTVFPSCLSRNKILWKKKMNTSGRPTGAFVPGWFWKTFWTVEFWQSSDTHIHIHIHIAHYCKIYAHNE